MTYYRMLNIEGRVSLGLKDGKIALGNMHLDHEEARRMGHELIRLAASPRSQLVLSRGELDDGSSTG